MPIYNKDGTVFKLQGVNPLMKEQDHWEEKWEVHNPETADVVVITDPKRAAIIADEISISVPSMIGVGALPQKDIIYCLPLISIIEEDPLYGQKQLKMVPGEKFSFEGIQIAGTGLTATFFTNLELEQVPIGSILYVYKERQWWKVNGVEMVEGGIHIHGMPSADTPSFT